MLKYWIGIVGQQYRSTDLVVIVLLTYIDITNLEGDIIDWNAAVLLELLLIVVVVDINTNTLLSPRQKLKILLLKPLF